jgi:hypothetical protein
MNIKISLALTAVTMCIVSARAAGEQYPPINEPITGLGPQHGPRGPFAFHPPNLPPTHYPDVYPKAAQQEQQRPTEVEQSHPPAQAEQPETTAAPAESDPAVPAVTQATIDSLTKRLNELLFVAAKAKQSKDLKGRELETTVMSLQQSLANVAAQLRRRGHRQPPSFFHNAVEKATKKIEELEASARDLNTRKEPVSTGSLEKRLKALIALAKQRKSQGDAHAASLVTETAKLYHDLMGLTFTLKKNDPAFAAQAKQRLVAIGKATDKLEAELQAQ